jgi:hypothetical protein
MNAVERRVRIHIQNLVLEGLPASACDQIAEALRTELARHMVENGWAWNQGAPTAIDAIDAGEIQLANCGTAASQGKAIAGAAFRSMEQANSPGRIARPPGLSKR